MTKNIVKRSPQKYEIKFRSVCYFKHVKLGKYRQDVEKKKTIQIRRLPGPRSN